MAYKMVCHNCSATTFFSGRRSTTTAVVAGALVSIALVIIWTSANTPNASRRSERLWSTNVSNESVSRPFPEDRTTLYEQSVGTTTSSAFKASPGVTASNDVPDANGSIARKSATFPIHRDVQYVTPLKKSENQYEDPPDRSSIANKRHHSGHFRLPTAIVWDPHPQYEFEAFGRTFHLRLAHDSNFISPEAKITHVKANGTIKGRPNQRSGCFYSGRVDGDPTSDVSVSLCDGMTGHIRTSNGSYIINPTKHWTHGAEKILVHILYREPKTRSDNSGFAPGDDSSASDRDCGVVDYDAENGAPLAMLDDNSIGDIYAGDRLRDRRSATADIFSDESRSSEFARFDDDGGGLENAEKTEDPFSGWRYRRALARRYYIEIMVVADAKMIDTHGSDLIPYIMVLMSTVYRIYKDPSIGNPISISVMKIVTVEQTFGKKHGTIGGISAAEMLKSFCNWQKINNPDEPSSEHHDTALLLTRENLCQEPEKQRCDMLGLAELGRMCSPGSSCAVVQDNGLATAFTIAHEIGHVLNMPHDDDSKCAKFHVNNGVHNFMTRRLDNNTFRWEWSKCSRYRLTEFLENAGCLLDEPSNATSVSDGIRLPGEDYSGNRQCELAFGTGSRMCLMTSADVCKKLWCTLQSSKEERCRTSNVPWADGTPCGDGGSSMKWCHRGECVSEKNLEPVDGQWGDWGPYGACSRTCGGGIEKKYRECNGPLPQNGGNYCVGQRVEHRSCRTEECPLDAMDFREEQCAEFDNNNLKIPGLAAEIKWRAKYTGLIPADRCKLFCQVDSNQYYMLRERVIDGTPCGPDTFHVCAQGRCRPAGCDHVLDSTARLDTCGVCGGDNSTCHRITGSHNSSIYGYTRVIEIPAGSSNIDVRQHGWNGSRNDGNYLALRTGQPGQPGEYVLNGKFMVMHRKVIVRPGLTIEYSGPETPVERLNSSRSINVDLVLEVLSVGNVYPPQISYRFTVPKHTLKNYRWILGDWSTCDYACDGTKYRKPRCRNIATDKFVPDDYCGPREKPREESQTCNAYCSLRWRVTVVSECSNDCGPGNRTISSQCVQIFKSPVGKTPEPVSNYACAHMTRPPNEESCVGPCRSIHWSYGEWQTCSATCGGGVQTRTAACIDAIGESVPESRCVAAEKIVERHCGQDTCAEWSIGEWSACSVSCGSGKRQRAIWCHVENRIVSAGRCSGNEPRATEVCDDGPCFRWNTGEWEACDTECGRGRQYRRIDCENFLGETVPRENCRWMKKPRRSRKCHGSSCVARTVLDEAGESSDETKRRWRVTDWTPCSKDCGDGIQQRAVTCHRVDEFGRVDPSPVDGCAPMSRPRGVRICKSRECNDEYYWSTGNWRKCSHPCGRKGRQTRRLFCHDATGKKRPRFHCPRNSSPKRERKCNQRRCIPKSCLEAKKRSRSMHDGEYALSVGGKSMKIYCHGIATTAPREYLTLPAGDGKNYAEIYDKRLLDPNQCPSDGKRNESCDCVSDDGTVSGLTNFKRVRINPTKLIIIADDFTFSRTEGAKRVDFGKAGDCYSRANCPQGRFSIDLTGTRFKLSSNVSWGSKNSKAILAIDRLNQQKIVGRCGGYCGFCEPETGLKLEIHVP